MFFSALMREKNLFCSSFTLKISVFCCCCILLIIWYALHLPQPGKKYTNLNFNRQGRTNVTTSTVGLMTNSRSTTASMTINTTASTSTTVASITKSSANMDFNQRRPRRCKLVICSIGNLGNQIWEYMSLFAVWKLMKNNNYVPSIEQKMWTNLKVLFPKLTISPKYSRICNHHNNWIIEKNKSLSEYKTWFTNDKKCRDVFLEEYSSRYEEVIKYGVDKIRSEMRFDEYLVRGSQMILHKFKIEFGLENENVTYVGIHYRGTDYENHLKINYGNYSTQIPDHRYYTKAMDYFNKKYENVIFILITVDQKWLSSNQKLIEKKGHVKVNPYKGDVRNHDLALLSNCNHSIINYGTFGATGALFSGGETFVYDLKLPLDHRGSTLAMGIAETLKYWHLSP